MITPEIGKIYVVKHSSGFIKAKFVRQNVYDAPKYRHTIYGDIKNDRRSTTHYVFENLSSGREIVIKSRVKIKREFVEQS